MIYNLCIGLKLKQYHLILFVVLDSRQSQPLPPHCCRLALIGYILVIGMGIAHHGCWAKSKYPPWCLMLTQYALLPNQSSLPHSLQLPLTIANLVFMPNTVTICSTLVLSMQYCILCWLNDNACSQVQHCLRGVCSPIVVASWFVALVCLTFGMYC